MTRKHKPQNSHKKRPVAPGSRPLKGAAPEKALAAVAGLREKDRGKHPPAMARKAAGATAARPGTPNPKMNDVARPADGKVPGGKFNADRRPLGLERRAPGGPEDPQSRLKPLNAPGAG